jgi:hypothetical protein
VDPRAGRTGAENSILPGLDTRTVHHMKSRYTDRHTIRRNEFVVNILEGAIPGKKVRGTTSTAILKASRQKQRS